MIQHIVAVKIFQIVLSGTIVLARLIETGAAQRHNIYIGLVNTAARTDLPLSARPLVADIRTVLSADSIVGYFAPTGIPAASCAPVEFHFVHIARVIYVDNGSAVALDGFLRNRLNGKTIIGLSSGARLRAGRTIQRLVFHIRVAVVIGILLPVDDGVPRTGIDVPVRLERDVLRQWAAEFELRSVVFPVAERVAGLRHHIGSCRGCVCAVELGRDICTAVGIEVEPVARFDLGVHGDILFVQRDGVDRGLVAAFQIPAGDRVRCVLKTVGHIVSLDNVAFHALFGMDNAAVRVGKEHVQHFRESGVRVDLRRFADLAHGTEGELGRADEPAGEFIAVLHGGIGLIERVALLDDLARDFRAVYPKDIGEIFVRIRPDNSHGDNVCLAALFALRGLFVLAGLFILAGLFALRRLFALRGLFPRNGLIACVRNGVFVSGGVGAASRRGIVSIFGKKRFLCRDGPLVSNGDRVHREQGEHHAYYHQQRDQIPLFHTVLLFSLTSPSLSDNFGRKCTAFSVPEHGFSAHGYSYPTMLFSFYTMPGNFSIGLRNISLFVTNS